jgi:predicted small integral membrane protein
MSPQPNTIAALMGGVVVLGQTQPNPNPRDKLGLRTMLTVRVDRELSISVTRVASAAVQIAISFRRSTGIFARYLKCSG